MLIVPQNDDAAFVRQIDAQSRVAVWAANHLNSRQISKLGLTHVLDGAADASGKKILHASGPGLTLERSDAVMPQGQLSYQYGMLSPVALAPQQMGNIPAPLAIQQFSHVSPHEIQQTISEMTGGCDPVYIAEELGLFQRDMDKVSGPKLCRYFCESSHFTDGFNFACFNADGNFKVRFALFRNSVFEAKGFKYTDLQEVSYFSFAPLVSAIYVPPRCCVGIFSTNASIAWRNPGMGWLCTAGGVENLDWEIIRRFGGNTQLVWPVFQDSPLLTRNQFSEDFAIVTEAKRRGVEMKILRAEATIPWGDERWDAQESWLDDREVKKLARKYGLEIDPVWNGLPGEIDFDDEPPVREVPPFWNGNGFAEFYGKKADELMQEFFEPRIKPWIPIGRIWLIIDKQDKQLARKARSTKKSHVRVATFEIFDDPERLQNEIRTETDLMFIVLPENGIPTGILDKCADIGVPVGVFSRKEDQNSLLDGYDATAFVVKKNTDLEKVFYIKNMKNGKIEKFKFFPSGVEETTGTEEDMRQGE